MVEGVSGNKVNVDPMLVNFRLDGNGDYRLSAGSPAIDNASTVGAVTKDVNQSLRPAVKDIGPYEYGVTGPFPIDVPTANAALVN